MSPDRARRRRPVWLATLVAVGTAAAGVALWTHADADAAGPRKIVVALNGSDAAAGTSSVPYGTIQKAVSVAQPGDTIEVRGGTYTVTTNITIDRSGTASSPITLTAAAGQRVVVDGDSLPASHTSVGGSIPAAQRGAFHLSASFWRIIGIEITRGPYGIYCDGCNDNVFERLVTQNNYETGFQLQGTSARNLILDLDSYLNHDPRKNGESADGIGVKEGSGAGNVIRGARLWNNVDDGLDLWKFASPVTIEDSVSYGNGVNRWNFPSFAGDGNGFKLGGGTPAPKVAHVVGNDIAFYNAATGFTDNGNPGSTTVTRCTAWKNGGTGFAFKNSSATLTENLSVNNGSAAVLGPLVKASGNSWNLGGPWNDARFKSTDPGTVTGPRAVDGSIVTSDFLVQADISIGVKL